MVAARRLPHQPTRAPGGANTGRLRAAAGFRSTDEARTVASGLHARAPRLRVRRGAGDAKALVAVGDDVVNLSWLPVPPPFGDEISSYTIYTRDEVTSSGVWSPFATIPGDQRSLTISSNERRAGRYYMVETALASGATEVRTSRDDAERQLI